MELKTLYHLGAGGAVYQWRIWTAGNAKVVEYGQVNGQKTLARVICEAKNVGRANSTTPERQAEIEALSDWQHKLDRKYHDSIDKVRNRKIDVMKAPTEKFADTKHYARYPADVQPKLDGARCLAYWEGDRVVLLSRGRKEWDLPHIKEQLAKILPKDAMWDGELYFHGVKRQTIQSWITKKYPQTKKIEYHVYDIPVAEGEERLWEERRLDLERMVPGKPMQADPMTPNIVKVFTMEVQDESQVWTFQTSCIGAGFEGCMLRNRKGRYAYGVRSNDLLKVKDGSFEETEFKVVGFKDGSGKNVGIVTWKCKINTPCTNPHCHDFCDNCTFDCDPLGSYKERAKWFQTADQYVGKMLTVKFQGYSEAGIPQFVKGVAFRLEQDMDDQTPEARNYQQGI